MKRLVLLTLILIAISLNVSNAQEQMKLDMEMSDTSMHVIRHGIILKKLFVDYKTLNGGPDFDFQKWNSGFEIGYLADLHENWSLAVPIKIASVRQYNESDYHQWMLGLDVQAQYHIIGKSHIVNPYASLGLGIVSENFDSTHLALPLAFGLNIPIGPLTDVNMEASYRLGFDDRKDNLQIGIGFIHRIGKVPATVHMDKMAKDSDGDGIEDAIDVCPQVPGLEQFFGCPDTDGDGIQDSMDDCPEQFGPKELKGCPDSDKDGVSDKMDECPNVAGSITNKGCPESVVPVDSDRDGIPDTEDDCPNEGGTIANKGCPEVVKITDRDNDGVPDAEDTCPDNAGPRSLRGCPDTDGDGLADYEDYCPNTAGSRLAKGCPDSDGDGVRDIDDRCPSVAGSVNNKGCPEISVKDKETLAFAVQNIEFDFGKSTIRTVSFSLLDQVADILNRYPAYLLRISGHTDNVGNAIRNQQLSERRARACYEYLASKNIRTKRMAYVGMGPSQPVAPNDTDDGRARNRRVEFDLFVE